MNSYFYWQSIRRTVAVFGTLFNNLEVVNKDSAGKVLKISRVPLSYGPRQKFLTRINQASDYNDERIAIKLPRMGFEITSLTYDATHKMQKMHFEKFDSDKKDKSVKDYAIGPVFYNMGIQLSIFAKNQDDALQIMEQILPYFQPQFTVTVKELKDSTKSDYPFTLVGVGMEDTYEGDFETRRAIIYTLDFETKVRFYGDVRTHALIKKADTRYFLDNNLEPDLIDSHIVVPWDSDSTDTHDIIRVKSFTSGQEYADVVLDTTIGLETNDPLMFTTTATVGRATSVDTATNTIALSSVDGDIEVGETVYIPNKPNYAFTVVSVNKRWK